RRLLHVSLMLAKTAINLLNKAYPKAKHLLRPDWRKENEKSKIHSTGFCYIASEALYHMLGGTKSGMKPMCAPYAKGKTHWWLEKNGNVYDPTADQYVQPPYHLG